MRFIPDKERGGGWRHWNSAEYTAERRQKKATRIAIIKEKYNEADKTNS